jgi:hypothetical protein
VEISGYELTWSVSKLVSHVYHILPPLLRASHGVHVENIDGVPSDALTISRKKRHLQLTDTNTQAFPINGTPLRKGNLDGLREKQKLNLANAGVGAVPHSKGSWTGNIASVRAQGKHRLRSWETSAGQLGMGQMIFFCWDMARACSQFRLLTVYWWGKAYC